MLINRASLSKTVDAINAAHFEGRALAAAERSQAARWIAARVLRQLRVRDPTVTRALEAADEGLLRCLARAAEDPRKRNPGLYCCGKCSVGRFGR